VFIIKMYYCFL